MILPKKKCLVSACLIGLCTRYDGQSKANPACMRYLEGMDWIPICPEQLGGLPTPRPPARLVEGDGHKVLSGQAKVLDQHGKDVSASFIQGAYMALAIAKAQQIELCVLKSGSPSCGLDPLTGVTAALFLQEKIQVLSF